MQLEALAGHLGGDQVRDVLLDLGVVQPLARVHQVHLVDHEEQPLAQPRDQLRVDVLRAPISD